ncbi:MAG: transcriptional regulator GcvA [Sneathiellaceae bacterium]
MPRRLPPLNALRAFEAAARHLSFKDAAEELNVTPAAISQQVKLLEEHVGAPLFRRLTRALVLTEVAQLALPALRAGFDLLADANEILASDTRQSVLTVSVAPSFGAKWLVPRLSRFQQAHPEIDVLIDAVDKVVDFERDNVDIALRFGAGDYPGLEVIRLFADRLFPVCSPALLDGAHPLRRPEDLRHHHLLHYQKPHSSDADPAWAMWLRAAGVEGVDGRRGPRFTAYTLALEAAVTGQGVALVESSLVDDDLCSGRLVRPFAGLGEMETEFSYYIVYPPGREKQAKVRHFHDWVMAEARAFLLASQRAEENAAE